MLSALARWPAKRIAAMWLGVAAWFAALAFLGVFARTPAERALRATTGPVGASTGNGARQLTPQARDSQEALAFAALKILAHDSLQGGPTPVTHPVDSAPLTAEQQDSLLHALGVSGRLSAAQRDSVPALQHKALEALTPDIAPAARSLGSVLLLMTVVVYGVPAIVCGLTIGWLIARWRHPPSAPTAAP